MKTSREQPILIVKRGGRKHGGGHGGAWKVAFADFMTSMMCLFLVLWLVGQSSDVRMAIQGYFRDPLGTARFSGSSPVPGTGSTLDAGQRTATAALLAINRRRLQELGDRIRGRLEQSPEWKRMENQIEVRLTDEGLRIQLLEDSAGTFFESGNATPSSKGRDLLQFLAVELATMPNPVVIEGHTDARPYVQRADYSNWELSSDRANAARRILDAAGLRAGQLTQVRGYGDRSLRTPDAPRDPRNRRVTILMLTQPFSTQSPTPSTGRPSSPAAPGAPVRQ